MRFLLKHTIVIPGFEPDTWLSQNHGHYQPDLIQKIRKINQVDFHHRFKFFADIWLSYMSFFLHLWGLLEPKQMI